MIGLMILVAALEHPIAAAAVAITGAALANTCFLVKCN